MSAKQTCTICGGSGKVKKPSGNEHTCKNCAGTGIIVAANPPIEEERSWPKE